MDSVDLLCQIVDGVDVPVPYLNTLELKAYFAFLTQTEQFADVRERFLKWFRRADADVSRVCKRPQTHLPPAFSGRARLLGLPNYYRGSRLTIFNRQIR